MRTVKNIVLIFFLILLSYFAEIHQVFAQQELNSVKDCLENPGQCESEPKNTEGKTDQGQALDSQKIGVSVWDFVKMIFATVFVVALIYFLFKFLHKRNREFETNALVQNIGGTRVGTNRSVQIIKVGNRVFVIGVGENVNLLTELDSKEANELLTKHNNELDKIAGPGDLISRMLKKKEDSKEIKDTNPFRSILEKQFDEMNKKRKQAYEEITKEGRRQDE